MTNCPHCKAAIGAASAQVVPNTSAEAQENWVLEELKRAGAAGRTTDDLRAGGVYQVSARVFGLRRRGAVIDTELYSGYAADGVYHHRMARYRLISEPLPFTTGDRKAEEAACS